MAKQKNAIVNDSEIAKILTKKINSLGKSQIEIAEDIGFLNPNMVTMIKQGRTKVPIAKVKAIANTLEIEPKWLLKRCLKEYQPENWEVIKDIFGIEI